MELFASSTSKGDVPGSDHPGHYSAGMSMPSSSRMQADDAGTPFWMHAVSYHINGMTLRPLIVLPVARGYKSISGR